jgi:hypothetical protein
MAYLAMCDLVRSGARVSIQTLKNISTNAFKGCTFLIKEHLPFVILHLPDVRQGTSLLGEPLVFFNVCIRQDHRREMSEQLNSISTDRRMVGVYVGIQLILGSGMGLKKSVSLG